MLFHQQSQSGDAASAMPREFVFQHPARPRLTLVHAPQEEAAAATQADPQVDDGWPWVCSGAAADDTHAPAGSAPSVETPHRDGPDLSVSECLVVQGPDDAREQAGEPSSTLRLQISDEEAEDAWWADADAPPAAGELIQEINRAAQAVDTACAMHELDGCDAEEAVVEVEEGCASNSDTPASVSVASFPADTDRPQQSIAGLSLSGELAGHGRRPLIPAAPSSIGEGQLVTARLTWKPGDPFADGDRPRFRWEVLLTSAGVTAACGLGAIWLLRSFLA